MIYFFHHYELPVILQQAQIREILIRNNGQVPININLSNNVNNNVNNNNNNNNVVNNNINAGRRLFRPRMRGFTLGGFRFRFGIVFHALQHPVNAAAQVNMETFFLLSKTMISVEMLYEIAQFKKLKFIWRKILELKKNERKVCWTGWTGKGCENIGSCLIKKNVITS